MPVSVERFIYENAIVQNNAPKFITEHYSKGQDFQYSSDEIGRFGLFETSSPNYQNFYPDIKPEDLKPQEGDYIYPTYRALSEVIVRPQRPIDFSQNGVLKKAMNLLVGQAVYPNHEMIAGDELGVVMGVNWSLEKKVKCKDGSSLTVPAGINAILKIDGKSNPRIARSINMNPPAMHSVSVTVEFEWEKSHKDMPDEQFYDQLGQYDAKGELVRRVVTKVNRFHEISLVPHGADPFAKKLDENGNIVLPDYAKATYKFQDSFSEEESYLSSGFISPKSYSAIDSFNSTPHDYNNANNVKPNKTEIMPEFLETLAKELGCQKDSEEFSTKAEAYLSELKEKAALVETLESEKKTLKSELESTKVTLSAKESELNNYLENLKSEVLKFANIVNNNNTPEATKEMISNADVKTSQTLLAQFQELAKEKLKSSVQNPKEIKEEGEYKELSLQEASKSLIDELYKVDTKNLHC